MADWATISSAATAAGTLVLAVATYSSVRSARYSSQVAERALLVGMRPVLAPSRPTDPPADVSFGDRHVVHVEGGRAGVDKADGVVYFVVPLRNVGAGLAVMHGWQVHTHIWQAPSEVPESILERRQADRPDPADFRIQQIDLYIPAGDTANWLGAIRDADDPMLEPLRAAYTEGRRIALDLLYGDHEGGQRTISRFGVNRLEDGQWSCFVIRHWTLDTVDPRSL